jgi:hypothetical protein
MKILQKYKFTEFILPSSMTEYGYIIDKTKVKFLVTKFLFTRRLPKMHELPEFFKRLGMFMGAYLYQKPLKWGTISARQDYCTSLCSSCDEDFSRLWEPHQTSCNVSLSRDVKTLNWLYFSQARPNERVVIQCNRLRDKMLAGYMVFDFLPSEKADTKSMLLTDICIEHGDPRILASLTSFAIDLGKQHNAALLLVWADSPETERYFRSTFSMKKTAKNYRYFKSSKTDTMNPEINTQATVCLPMIYPPQ